MKKYNQIFVIFLFFLLAFVLPVAVLAVKESKGGDKQQAQLTISTEEINDDIDNVKSEIEEEAIEVDIDEEIDEGSGQGPKKAWVLQKKALIQEKRALTDSLEEAELRLEHFETEYETALSLGDPVEIDRLFAEIATEKSNIVVIKTQMKKTIEEMHKVKVFTNLKWESKI